MFSCSFIYILSPLRTIFSPPTNQTTLNRQTGRADHFPRSRYPNQAIFLTAYLQTRPFSSQQTFSPDLFPRSRPPIQTIFHAADLQSRPFSTRQTSDQTMTRPPTSQLISQPQICSERPTSRHSGQIVSLWVGLREVNKKQLWMNLATHTIHTRSA